MPEFKNTFQGGKMEKDLDERIVPSGVYREALNISVSTSEDSDVGAAQNILANIKVTRAINGPNQTYSLCSYSAGGATNGRYYGTNAHIASVVDPQTDMIYRFVNTTPGGGNNHGVWMDRIVEYDTTKSIDTPWHQKEKSVLVDIYKVITKVNGILTLDPTCNKSTIEVCTNTYQLREGMTLHISGKPSVNEKGVFIEHINYPFAGAYAHLYLSDNIDSDLPGQGNNITFRGDRVLNFDPSRKITAINIMDGMIFWTDNYSEPKKINIKRSKQGSNSFLYGAGWNPSSPNSAKSYGCPGGGSCYSDFDMHTKLIINDIPAYNCDKQNLQCPTYGCTDPTATNYDGNATMDDGSCTYPPPTIYGCTNVLACNYNENATDDNGSCLIPGACEQCSWGCPGVDTDPEQDGSGTLVTITNAWNCDNSTFCNSAYTCIPNEFENDDCSDRDEAFYDGQWTNGGAVYNAGDYNFYDRPGTFLHAWSDSSYYHVLDNFFYWRKNITNPGNWHASQRCWEGFSNNFGVDDGCQEPTENPNCIDDYTHPNFIYYGDPSGQTVNSGGDNSWRFKDTIESLKLWVTDMGGDKNLDPEGEHFDSSGNYTPQQTGNPIIDFDLSVWSWYDIVAYLQGQTVHGETFCFNLNTGGGAIQMICPKFNGIPQGSNSCCPPISLPSGATTSSVGVSRNPSWFSDPDNGQSYPYQKYCFSGCSGTTSSGTPDWYLDNHGNSYPKTIGEGVIGELFNGCNGDYFTSISDNTTIRFKLEYHTKSCECTDDDGTSTSGSVTFNSNAPECVQDPLGSFSDLTACTTSPCVSTDGWSGGDWDVNPSGPIYGCTNNLASNYDATATIDDGSCIFANSSPVGGCMQPSATNFQEYVNFDDGSCYWCSMTDGNDNAITSVLADGDVCSACLSETNYSGYDYVTDGWVNTQSFYPSDLVFGCTDPLAYNYDENATCDDPNNPCVAIIMGCTDPLAANYYSFANVDDGSCLYTGCTDPNADNYDENASIDDGSCLCNGAPCSTARVATPPPTTPPPTIPPINTPLSSPRTTPDREQRMDEGYNLPSPLKNGSGSTAYWYCCQDSGGCTDNVNLMSVMYGHCYQATGADIPTGQQGYGSETQCNTICSQATSGIGGGLGVGLDDSAFDDYWGDPSGPVVTITDTPTAVVNPIRGGVVDPEANFTITCSPEYVLEKHITVIRRGPTAPPRLQMYSWTDDADLDNDDSIIIKTSFNGGDMPQTSNWHSAAPGTAKGTGADGSDTSIFFTPQKEIKGIGDHVILPLNINNSGVNNAAIDWEAGMKLSLIYNYTDNFGNGQVATCRLVVIDTTFTYLYDDGSGYTATYATDVGPYTVGPSGIKCKILAISEGFPSNGTTVNDIYTVTAEQIPPLFEFKFPKFAYRYKYEDGEYSVFGPWSEIAFMPGEYDYLPKKGYNLGMVNTMRSLKILNWNPKNRPSDVVEIDILYKESNSTNVYTVATFKPDDVASDGGTNEWNSWGTGSNKGNYTITSELIHKVVPSNQMLRPWDNVPRMALGQEVTANRLIYANYLQNYNNLNDAGEEIKPAFGISIDSTNYSLDSDTPLTKQPLKSLKSMRTYQLGVVYRDRYGRETPVLTSNSGSVDIPKASAKLQNSLSVEMTSPPPAWAESYTFYIKETSNEYYNLAMDRWYNAEDDGLWLSFPSSERNKLSERSMLILKKQHDTDVAVDSDVRYKVLDIKNNAPTFIKTEYQFWGSVPMMLPPPGWGEGTKAGNWDTGMFHITGLPLPNRLYIDVYAEYFDQSVLADLTKSTGAQVRITQTIGAPSSYNSAPSQSVNKSKWYDVSNISYVGSPQEMYTEVIQAPNGNEMEIEQEVPGQAEQIVRITLENIIGEDMSFCEPTDNLSLARGLSLEARTQVVKDRSQFEGRFFVKVLRDPELQTHIVQSGQTAQDNYQVLMARDIKYICMAHPGVQDWMTGAAGTVGANKGKWFGNLDEDGIATNYNYIPVGKRWVKQWTNIGTATTAGAQEIKAEVSSLHDQVGWATYYDKNNAAQTPSQTVDEYWPMGPGTSANAEYMSGWFLQKYYNYINHNVAKNFADHYKNTFGPNSSSGNMYPTYGGIDGDITTGNDQSIWPDSAAWANPWPSFMTSSFQPAMCGGTDQPGVNDTWGVDDCSDMNAAFLYRGSWEYGLDLSLKADVLTDGLDPAFRAKRGANAFNVPAIWGDQSDLLGYTGNAANPTVLNNADTAALGSFGSNQTGSALPHTYPSHYSASTIVKLRKDWYHLWWGRDKVDDNWPLGRFSPERWFIDKVGAAHNYSGNGIWVDDTGVSHMDLSFYGIGNLNTQYRSYDTITHQENEFAFGEAMATSGTQFRFKQDPNGTVYTVTRAEIQYVKNYEVGQGSFGYFDMNWVQSNGNLGSTNGTYSCLGGGGMGSGICPPYGSMQYGTNSIASKEFFISDLFNRNIEMTGGAPYNYRVRVSLTLDKEIGSEGKKLGTANTGFHPIKNHVDIDGNCNIKYGAQRYYQGGPSNTAPGWKAAHGTFTEEEGATPFSDKFFNLSSYWNNTSGAAPTSTQSDQMGVGDVDGQHFGLHERGLNATTIEIVTSYKGDEGVKNMSRNPAIWETEPMEDVGLDIYYAASPTYPINLQKIRNDQGKPDPIDRDRYNNTTGANWFDYGWRGEEVVPVGSAVFGSCSGCTGTFMSDVYVTGVQGNTIWIDTHAYEDASGTPKPLTIGDKIRFEWQGEGYWYGGEQDKQYIELEVLEGIDLTIFKVKPNAHTNVPRSLSYFNCYTFNNGVESNRIRDDYNAVTIDKGVKASMPLATPYEEERKASSLIFSGIYNSTSGVNDTNQFIQAEPITKDLNPINGSIQKLFARDTDLVTFCENKVFKILAKKDALFNADGNTNVTSNANVLGQSIAFTGEYGISKNPESFASESYRIYFADKARGAVLRLSRDGLTPISDQGMKDWFKDNLRFASSIIGSYDDRDDQYNITIETEDQDGNPDAYTLSYVEKVRGWVSFKSFVHQDGLSHKNIYYTWPSTVYSEKTSPDPWGVNYSDGVNLAETYQHGLDIEVHRFTNTASSSNSIVVGTGTGVLLKDMNVQGNGIPTGTIITSTSTSGPNITVNVNNICFVQNNQKIKFTTARNNFYGIPHYSMVKTLFNKGRGNVLRYKTLSYEGSQAQVVPRDSFANFANYHQLHSLDNVTLSAANSNMIIEDNYQKEGWYVNDISTDLQSGRTLEFVNKENRWYNYIRGKADAGWGDDLDAGEFSLQGIGIPSSIITT